MDRSARSISSTRTCASASSTTASPTSGRATSARRPDSDDVERVAAVGAGLVRDRLAELVVVVLERRERLDEAALGGAREEAREIDLAARPFLAALVDRARGPRDAALDRVEVDRGVGEAPLRVLRLRDELSVTAQG